MNELEGYIKSSEPERREKAEAWQAAIGLQAVDGLQTSEYLYDTARKHIEGDISIDEAKDMIAGYYRSRAERDKIETRDTEEADKVSANITQLLGERSISFTVSGLASIHRRLFDGILPSAGKFRTYDISKREWVLNGGPVLYVNSDELTRAIEYDLEQERRFAYRGLSNDEIVEHIARFVSNIWQIHPFSEGNTRTTAVFTIKYLRSIGFEVNNDQFARHSWYFRNALVRANYRNVRRGIDPDMQYLIRFFRNLLLGETNELRNRDMRVDVVK